MMQQQKQHLHPILGLWPWILLTLGLTILPYGWVAHSTPEGQNFLGSLINTGDLSVYLAAIRQGAEGAWLFEVTFTPEPMTPKITYPLYLALGRLATPLNVDVLWLFHGSRVLAGLFLLGVVAVWLQFLEMKKGLSDAFFLIFLAGGWGWLVFPAGWVLPDIHVAEWLPFLSIFHAPHFALGIAAEIGLMTALLMAYRQSATAKWPLALAIFSALSLTLLYPYRLIPVGLAIGIYGLIEIGRRWRPNLPLLITSTAALLVLGSMSLYYALVARADPFWEATHVIQNEIPSPNPLEAFLGLGIVGLLGLFVGRVILTKGWFSLPDGIRLCLIWFGAGFGCLYLPVSFQGRFALNIYLPLAVVGAWGLHHELLPHLAAVLAQKGSLLYQFTANPAAIYHKTILFVAFLGIVMAVGLRVARTNLLPEQYFMPQRDIQAAEWLIVHGQPDDLVLAQNRMGNYLPRYFQGRVFVGQYYITVNSEQKTEWVEYFFAPHTAESWRLALLDEWQVDYIYYGTHEAKLGPPPQLPNWTIVYDQDGVIIYQRP